MTKKQAIKLFEERKVRTVWDDEKARPNACQRVGTNCHPPFRSDRWWTAKNELRDNKGNLRDNMTNLEIALNILAEASTTELSKQRNPKGYKQQKRV